MGRTTANVFVAEIDINKVGSANSSVLQASFASSWLSILRLEAEIIAQKLDTWIYQIGVSECRADRLYAGGVESRPVAVAVRGDGGW